MRSPRKQGAGKLITKMRPLKVIFITQAIDETKEKECKTRKTNNSPERDVSATSLSTSSMSGSGRT